MKKSLARVEQGARKLAELPESSLIESERAIPKSGISVQPRASPVAPRARGRSPARVARFRREKKRDAGDTGRPKQAGNLTVRKRDDSCPDGNGFGHVGPKPGAAVRCRA